MSSSRTYPFSDLSPAEIRLLMHAAKVEQARSVREFIRSLFHRSSAQKRALIESETPASLRPCGA